MSDEYGIVEELGEGRPMPLREAVAEKVTGNARYSEDLGFAESAPYILEEYSWSDRQDPSISRMV
ncbi:MAG: hypothetical protein ABEJ72_09175, partial [Candidatus Aenigmatarchaeota archaeon]